MSPSAQWSSSSGRMAAGYADESPGENAQSFIKAKAKNAFGVASRDGTYFYPCQ